MKAKAICQNCKKEVITDSEFCTTQNMLFHYCKNIYELYKVK